MTSYKLILIARHGQGYHNVAESLYGTAAWNCPSLTPSLPSPKPDGRVAGYWSELNTDGNITWGPDSRLTPLGISQAQNVNKALKREREEGFEMPGSYYSSPLSRSASTFSISWDGVGEGVKAVFKEGLR